MWKRKITGLISLIILALAMGACSSDDGPANSIVLGNGSALEFFQEFTNPELVGFIRETRNTGTNFKFFRDSVDFDQDGSIDLQVDYNIFRRVEGDTLVQTTILSRNSELRVLGDSIEVGNQMFWEPNLYDEGMTVGLDSDIWLDPTIGGFFTIADAYQYVSFDNSINTLTRLDANGEGYLVLRLPLAQGQGELLGWVKIGVFGSDRKPAILEYGYLTVR